MTMPLPDVSTKRQIIMPDITMCTGERCPLKQICYRHTAKPSEFRQSYFMKPPISEGKCEYFWKTEPKRCKYVKRETCDTAKYLKAAIEKIDKQNKKNDRKSKT